MNKLKTLIKKSLNYNPLYWLNILKIESKIKKLKPLSNINRNGVALVWFSYSGDFEILSSSLRSVDLFTNSSFEQLIIVQDISSPFSLEQINHLSSLTTIPLIFIDSLLPLGWAGISTIASEINAFHEIFNRFNIKWLAKIDSDALIISDKFFSSLIDYSETPLFIGHSARELYINNTVTKNTDWAQGGSYCFNFTAFNKAINTSLISPIWQTLKKIDLSLKYLPEDIFFTHLFNNANINIQYIHFHFPIWFRKDLFPPISINSTENYYSILHFEGCKKFQIQTLDEMTSNTSIQKFLYNKWTSENSATTLVAD